MWISWFFGGFIAFCIKRYFKQFWFIGDIIHIVIGFWIIFATFLSFGTLYAKLGQLDSLHAIIAYIMLAPLAFIPLNGLGTALTPRFKKTPDW